MPWIRDPSEWARTSAALDRAIADGLAAISAQDARGYFAHRGYLGKLNRETL